MSPATWGLEEPMSCGGLRVRRAVLETLNVEVVVVVVVGGGKMSVVRRV